MFKSWEFYRSRPFAGNKQSVHIASFSAGHTSSHRSAGHTIFLLCEISKSFHYIFQYIYVIYVQLLYFCWMQNQINSIQLLQNFKSTHVIIVIPCQSAVPSESHKSWKGLDRCGFCDLSLNHSRFSSPWRFIHDSADFNHSVVIDLLP